MGGYVSPRLGECQRRAGWWGGYRLRDVRAVMDRQAAKQDQFAFAEEHEIIRSLSEYQELVHSAFQENL